MRHVVHSTRLVVVVAVRDTHILDARLSAGASGHWEVSLWHVDQGDWLLHGLEHRWDVGDSRLSRDHHLQGKCRVVLTCVCRCGLHYALNCRVLPHVVVVVVD